MFSLRGVSMFDYSLNQSSPVATYVDEVYKGNFALFGVELFDMERVEVLRGPQGTLYGKNTTGGAINFVSRAPSFDSTDRLSSSSVWGTTTDMTSKEDSVDRSWRTHWPAASQ